MLKKIIQLAIASTSFAVIAFIGSTPASAANFNLSGKFSSYFDNSLDNGSFDGSYSLQGLLGATDSSLVVNSFLVNLRDATGTIVATLNSEDIGSYGGISSYPGYIDLFLSDGSSSINLDFNTGFTGIGSVIPTDFSLESYSLASADGVFANVASGTSTPVPEPSNLSGIVVLALGAGRLLKKKIANF